MKLNVRWSQMKPQEMVSLALDNTWKRVLEKFGL